MNLRMDLLDEDVEISRKKIKKQRYGSSEKGDMNLWTRNNLKVEIRGNQMSFSQTTSLFRDGTRMFKER